MTATPHAMAQPADIGYLRRLIPPFLLFGFISNLVILISPLFMMQVLDRVVPSGNTNTLILLLGFALSAIAVNIYVEYSRDRSLGRIGRWIEETCITPILNEPSKERAGQIDDLKTLRDFFQSSTPSALMALAWLPLFLLCLALIHPLYLLLITILSTVMIGFKTLSDSWSKDSKNFLARLQMSEIQLFKQLDAANANPRADLSTQHLAGKICDTRAKKLHSEDQSDRPRIAATSVTTGLRMAIQLFALSLGAYLVSQHLMTAGAMIAASVITAKTIGTIEQAGPALSGFKTMRAAFQKLQSIQPKQATGIDVVDFAGKLTAAGITFPRGNGAPPRLDRVSFKLEAGECMAIIGEAGSGKSTLLTALAGLQPAPIGGAMLDNTDVRHLSRSAQSKAIGYCPQLPNLMPGTVTQMISGFDPQMDIDQVVNTAKLAKAHGLISALPGGYETNLETDGYLLTAGQRHLLSLAAALYQQPKYLFLDEPNSLLDQNSERGLCNTLEELKSNGTTIVMVLHRAGIIGLADQVAVLERGRVSDFGPRSQVLGRQTDQRRHIRLPLRPSSLQDLSDWIANQFQRTSDADFANKAILLGTELFQAAYLNGDTKTPREMFIDFTFLDRTTCEMQMTEEGPNGAKKLLPKIKAAIKEGHTAEKDLKPQERPLYLASQISDCLKIDSNQNRSCFKAQLTKDFVTPDERAA